MASAAIGARAVAAASAHKDKEHKPKTRPSVKVASEVVEEPITEGFWKYQPQALVLYNNYWVQVFVAALIVGNFVTNICEKQMDPYSSSELYSPWWNGLEWFFNVIFFFELALNMYGSWLYPFWASGWNVFDFIVVSISIMTTLSNLKVFDIPEQLSLIRLARAFRVFRLFKRVKELRKIIRGLGRSLDGMMYAFLIMLIVMCVYAILAVELFGPCSELGTEMNPMTQCPEVSESDVKDAIDKYGQDAKYESGRDLGYNFEYYGTFFRSLYTLFQVLTGESWSEAIARPLLEENPILTGIFFVTFVLINGVILFNVVIAVLLEKFCDPGDDEGDEEIEGEEEDEAAAASLNEATEPTSSPSVDLTAITAEMDSLKTKVEKIEGKLESIASGVEALCKHLTVPQT